LTRNNALIRRLSTKNRIKTFSGGRTIVQELAYADNSTFETSDDFFAKAA